MSVLDAVQSIDPKYAKEICAAAKTFLESQKSDLDLGKLVSAAGPLAAKAQTFVELKGAQKAQVVVDGLCAFLSEHAPIAKAQKDVLILQVRNVLPPALTLLVEASQGKILLQQARGLLAPLLACIPGLSCLKGGLAADSKAVAKAEEPVLKKVPVSSEPEPKLEVRNVEETKVTSTE